MDLLCDRFSVCGSKMVGWDSRALTVMHARARGWHIWSGVTQGGQEQTVVLCERCVESKRRDLPPAPDAVEGQASLFDTPPPGEVP